MEIQFTWEKAPLFEDQNGFFIQVHKSEINDSILLQLSDIDRKWLESGQYLDHVNSWNAVNPELSEKDCIYLLVSEDLKHVKIENPEFPYSGLWNSNNPLKKAEGKIDSLDDIGDYIIKNSIRSYLKARTDIIDIGRRYPQLIGGNDNIIGRIGEYLAIKFLESIGQNPSKILESSNPGYDLIENDLKTQVKCLTKENKNGKSVRLTQPWNQFLLLELSDDYLPERIGIITDKQFEVARSENTQLSQNPVVKIGMLSDNGLLGKYGKVYSKEIIRI